MLIFSRQNRFKCCSLHDLVYIFLDNGVMTTPKRRILSFVFTVLYYKKKKQQQQQHLVYDTHFPYYLCNCYITTTRPTKLHRNKRCQSMKSKA